jgi:hypothetical protein
VILSSERVIVVGHQFVTQNLRDRDGVLGVRSSPSPKQPIGSRPSQARCCTRIQT